MSRTLLTLTAMLFASQGVAGEVTYRQHIKPLFDQKCAMSHGPNSPYYGDFKKDKDKYKGMMRGPRMDSYADLIYFIGWPDTGAIMRRLDDGTNAKDGKPGNMYNYLGSSESERNKNLALFRSWVGDDAWRLNRWKARGDVPGITKEQLDQIKVKY